MPLTFGRLHQRLIYNSITGDFHWLPPIRGRGSKKSIAGCPDGEGYIMICVDRRIYKAHRLAWFYIYGEWPQGEIDHKDRNRSNNAIANLRIATRNQNSMNSSLRIDNISGVTGIVWDQPRKRWRVRIHHNGKEINLGRFISKSEAISIRASAETEFYGLFARDAK